NHVVALFQLKIDQALSNTAFYRISRVDIAAVEIKQQRLRVAVFQALIPALGNYQRCPHTMGEQVRFVLRLARSVPPPERLVLGNNIDEFLRPRCVVPIDQQGVHIGQFDRLKRVTEKERKQRWQQQHEQQHTPIAIDVQKLFVSDALGRLE